MERINSGEASSARDNEARARREDTWNGDGKNDRYPVSCCYGQAALEAAMGNFAATASMAARLTQLEALVNLEEEEQTTHVPDRVEISYSISSDSFDISMVRNGEYILRGATAPEVIYLMATGWYRVGRCSIDGTIHYMWPERG